MVDITIDTSDVERLARDLAKDAIDVAVGVRTAIIKTAFEVRNNAVNEIQRGAKSGYTYTWRGVAKGLKPDSFRRVKGRVIPVKLRSKPHTASRAGQAPASDTGNLVNSIRVKESIGLRAEVTAGAGYSGYLEDEMNRAFMEPAYNKAEPYLNRQLDQVLSKALR